MVEAGGLEIPMVGMREVRRRKSMVLFIDSTVAGIYTSKRTIPLKRGIVFLLLRS